MVRHRAAAPGRRRGGARPSPPSPPPRAAHRRRWPPALAPSSPRRPVAAPPGRHAAGVPASRSMRRLLTGRRGQAFRPERLNTCRSGLIAATSRAGCRVPVPRSAPLHLCDVGRRRSAALRGVARTDARPRQETDARGRQSRDPALGRGISPVSRCNGWARSAGSVRCMAELPCAGQLAHAVARDHVGVGRDRDHPEALLDVAAGRARRSRSSSRRRSRRGRTPSRTRSTASAWARAWSGVRADAVVRDADRDREVRRADVDRIDAGHRRDRVDVREARRRLDHRRSRPGDSRSSSSSPNVRWARIGPIDRWPRGG